MYFQNRPTTLLTETNPIAEAIREHFLTAQFDDYKTVYGIRMPTGSGKTFNGKRQLVPTLYNGAPDCDAIVWSSFSLEVLPGPRESMEIAQWLNVEFIDGRLYSADKIRSQLHKAKERGKRVFLVVSCHKMYAEDAADVFPMSDALSDLWPDRWAWINDEGTGLTPLAAYKDTLGHTPDPKNMHETMFRAFVSAKTPFKYLLEATTTRYTSGLLTTTHGVTWKTITPEVAPSAIQSAAVPDVADVLTFPVTLASSGDKYEDYHLSDLSKRKIAFKAWVENHFDKEKKVPQVGQLVGVHRIKGVGMVMMSTAGAGGSESKYRMDVRSDLPWMLLSIQETAMQHGFSSDEIEKMCVLWTDVTGEFGTEFVSAHDGHSYNIEHHPYSLDDEAVMDLSNASDYPLRFVFVVNKGQVGVDIPRLTSIWINKVQEAKLIGGGPDLWGTNSIIENILQAFGRGSRPHPLLWDSLTGWLGTYSLLPILQGPNRWNQNNLDLLLELMTLNIGVPNLPHYHDALDVFSTHFHLTKSEMRKEWRRIGRGVPPR